MTNPQKLVGVLLAKHINLMNTNIFFFAVIRLCDDSWLSINAWKQRPGFI